MSVNNISPTTFLGGTWEQIENKFLLAAGSSYNGGSTGGSTTHTHTSATHTHTTAGHTLTISEMPSHRHYLQGHTYTWGPNQGTVYIQGATARAGQMTTGNDLYTYQNEWAYSAYTGSGGSHSHGDTGSTTPGNTGSSSNLPPYLAVYIWKRTA